MQPYPAHQAVDDERHPRQISDILEHRDEQKQHRDLRHEDDHVADTGDDAVDHETADGTGRQQCADAALESRRQPFDHADQRL